MQHFAAMAIRFYVKLLGPFVCSVFRLHRRALQNVGAVSIFVRLLVTKVSCTKTSAPIEIPFGNWTLIYVRCLGPPFQILSKLVKRLQKLANKRCFQNGGSPPSWPCEAYSATDDDYLTTLTSML